MYTRIYTVITSVKKKKITHLISSGTVSRHKSVQRERCES